MRMFALLIACWISLPPARAAESFFEKRLSCAAVRLALKQYDAATLESMARAKGLSEETIARLKRCVK